MEPEPAEPVLDSNILLEPIEETKDASSDKQIVEKPAEQKKSTIFGFFKRRSNTQIIHRGLFSRKKEVT